MSGKNIHIANRKIGPSYPPFFHSRDVRQSLRIRIDRGSLDAVKLFRKIGVDFWVENLRETGDFSVLNYLTVRNENEPYVSCFRKPCIQASGSYLKISNILESRFS